MEIVYLDEMPSAIDLLASAFWEEWGVHDGLSLAEVTARLVESCRRDALPLALVAREGETVLGTVGLTRSPVVSRPVAGPWLVALWVHPAHRGRGIGARLVAEAERAAAGLGGVTELYAATSTAVALFRRAGWVELERFDRQGERLTLFRRELPARPHSGGGPAPRGPIATTRPLTPVHTAPLFRPLLAELLDLLRGLAPGQWDAPTVAGAWRVRDVAAHLLDGDLRRIAAGRDGHVLAPEAPIRTARDLASFVNALNAGGVAWARRLSPRLLVDLLAITGAWAADLLEALPPHEPALWPVSWAGEDASESWMDVGREYTERWHHQMQIRDAVGAPATLLEPRWYRPLLDLSVRALPKGYADVPAPEGTAVAFVVTARPGGADGDATLGAWTLVREAGRWVLQEGEGGGEDATAVVRATADAAWRLLYNALPDPAPPAAVRIEGDRRLAEPLLRTRSIVL